MATDLSRLPSPRCPAARALRLRDRLAARRGPAWTVAAALALRLAKVVVAQGVATSKLRPGATIQEESPSIEMRAELLPEPPWQEGDSAAPDALVLTPQAESMEGISNEARLRPPANIGERALPTICLTPRLLPIPAARVA